MPEVALERYQPETPPRPLKTNLIPRDVSRFYSSLSPIGRRVIGILLQQLGTLDSPVNVVLASLGRRVGCSKISVLRHLAKGEEMGMFSRAVNSAGRRHGTLVTPHKERCSTFLKLFHADYGLLGDTNADRYQARGDTKHDRYPDTNGDRYANAASAPGSTCGFSAAARRVLGAVVLLSDGADEYDLTLGSVAARAMCSEITARRTLNRGAESGLFRKSVHPRGPRFGLRIRFDSQGRERLSTVADTNLDRYTSDHDTNRVWYHDQVDTDPDTSRDRYQDTKADRYPENGRNPRSSCVSPHNEGQGDTKADRYQPAPLLDRQINLSVWGRRLLELTRDDFEVSWPQLLENGFGPDQVRQIVQFRDELGQPLDDILGSLHSAQWQLANGHFPENRKGPANYLFATLKNSGTFCRHEQYVSPEQQALNNARKALEAEKAAAAARTEIEELKQRQLDGEAFDEWHDNLTEGERATIDAAAPVRLPSESSRIRWRRSYWSKLQEKGAA